MQAHLNGSGPQWSCHLTALCVTRVDRVVLWWLLGWMGGWLAPALEGAEEGWSDWRRGSSARLQCRLGNRRRKTKKPPLQLLTYPRWQCFGKAWCTSQNRGGSFFISSNGSISFFNFVFSFCCFFFCLFFPISMVTIFFAWHWRVKTENEVLQTKTWR